MSSNQKQTDDKASEWGWWGDKISKSLVSHADKDGFISELEKSEKYVRDNSEKNLRCMRTSSILSQLVFCRFPTWLTFFPFKLSVLLSHSTQLSTTVNEDSIKQATDGKIFIHNRHELKLLVISRIYNHRLHFTLMNCFVWLSRYRAWCDLFLKRDRGIPNDSSPLHCLFDHSLLPPQNVCLSSKAFRTKLFALDIHSRENYRNYHRHQSSRIWGDNYVD